MKRRLVGTVAWVVLLAPAVRAGQMSVYYSPSAQVEYEGTGYRSTAQGWELKVKPLSAATGFVWDHDLTKGRSLNIQYWRNESYYHREDGNALSATLRQTGLTRLAFHNVLAGLRVPVKERRLAASLGLQGVRETFDRTGFVFNGNATGETACSSLGGIGACLGLHGGSKGVEPKKCAFYSDWDLMFGHLFLTTGRPRAEGGSIHRDGYTYTFRLEAGVSSPRWRCGLSYVRQLFQVQFPGGASLPSGAAASLPINKTDFFGPFLNLSYVY
ncbi:MAG TPA: hypothetical protein PK876_05050 [Elusimicrobiota bacterium]|nr:hypothetical protein [Elusimicrobiota bacterium]